MRKTKFEKFQQEFPFLSAVLPKSVSWEELKDITIKKADAFFLLNFIPKDNEHGGSMGSSDSGHLVSFVLSTGEVLYDGVRRAESASSNYPEFQPRTTVGESIAEAIDRLGIAAQVEYIAVFSYEVGEWENQEPVESFDLTIYKRGEMYFPAMITLWRAQAVVDVRARSAAARNRRLGRFVLHGYLTEFPFIPHALPNERTPEELTSIELAWLDFRDIYLRPQNRHHDGSEGWSSSGEIVSFVLSTGQVVHDAVTAAEDTTKDHGHYQPYRRAGESVLQAVARLGIAESVEYVVVYEYDIRNWPGQESTPLRKLRILDARGFLHLSDML